MLKTLKEFFFGKPTDAPTSAPAEPVAPYKVEAPVIVQAPEVLPESVQIETKVKKPRKPRTTKKKV